MFGVILFIAAIANCNNYRNEVTLYSNSGEVLQHWDDAYVSTGRWSDLVQITANGQTIIVKDGYVEENKVKR